MSCKISKVNICRLIGTTFFPIIINIEKAEEGDSFRYVAKRFGSVVYKYEATCLNGEVLIPLDRFKSMSYDMTIFHELFWHHKGAIYKIFEGELKISSTSKKCCEENDKKIIINTANEIINVSVDVRGLKGERGVQGVKGDKGDTPELLWDNIQNKPNFSEVFAGAGKNISNADLTTTAARTFTQAHNYTHYTAGFYYHLKGLPDKSKDVTFDKMLVEDGNGRVGLSDGKPVIESLMQGLPSNKLSNNVYDSNYSEYLVFNPNTGKVAKSDKPQIITNFTVPNAITIKHNTNVANVNWQPNPSYPQDLTDTLDFVKSIDSIGFTPVLANEFVVSKLPNSKFPSSVSNFNIPDFEFREGEMLYNGNVVGVPAGFRDLYYQANNEENNALINIFINKELPVDKDWVFRFRTFNSNLLGTVNSFLDLEKILTPNLTMS